MVFEVLNRFFMCFRSLPRSKCAQVATPPCLRILLPRIQPELTTLQFSNHRLLRHARFLVRLAFVAAFRRAADPRLPAAVFACRDKDASEAAECPFRFRARLVARERRAEGFRRLWLWPLR